MDCSFRKLGRIAVGMDIENMGQRRHHDIKDPRAHTMIGSRHPCGIWKSMGLLHGVFSTYRLCLNTSC